MGLKIIWDDEAKIFLKKSDKHISKRIAHKIDDIILNPERYIFSLINIGISKIRVGDYRIFVNYYKEDNKLIVRSIRHRKNAYKRK